jgi:hypothetical protein
VQPLVAICGVPAPLSDAFDGHLTGEVRTCVRIPFFVEVEGHGCLDAQRFLTKSFERIHSICLTVV